MEKQKQRAEETSHESEERHFQLDMCLDKKESQVEGIPNMADLLPACPIIPRVSGIPGLTVKEKVDWPEDDLILWKKQMGTKPDEHILFAHLKATSQYDTEKVKDMISLASSCPSKTQLQGFASAMRPSVIKLESAIKTTCPERSSIRGIPSRSVIQDDKLVKEWLGVKQCLLVKPLKNNVLIINTPAIEYSVIYKALVDIVLTCPMRPLVLGFPSVPFYKEGSDEIWTCPNLENSPKSIAELLTERIVPEMKMVPNEEHQEKIVASQHQVVVLPTMSDLVPSCPLTSRIPGCPSKQGFKDVKWIHDEIFYIKPSLRNIMLVSVDTYKEIQNIENNMVLFPTCPYESCIPGLPSVLWPICRGANMQKMCPSCPVHSLITGFQSIQTSASPDWPSSQTVLWVRQSKSPTLIRNEDEWQKLNLKRMIALVPTCSSKKCIPGFPAVPEPKMINIRSTCPKMSNIVGFSSKQIVISDWIVDTRQLYCREPKHECFIRNTETDEELIKLSFALAPTCPEASTLPGFPSAPTPKMSYNMVNVQHCVPKSSRTSGFLSEETIMLSDFWLLVKEVLWVKSLTSRSCILAQCFFDIPCERLHYNIMKRMHALVPTCPTKAQTSGFPSVPYVKVDHFYLRNEPDIISILNSCPGITLVSGFPSINYLSSVKSWIVQGKPIYVNRSTEKCVFISNATKNIDYYGEMVPLASRCPKKSSIPGFPSSNQLNYSMTFLLPSALKTLELPSEEGQHQAVVYPSLFRAKPVKMKEAVIINTLSAIDDKTNMFALVPCCTKNAQSPGFPSVNITNGLVKSTVCESFSPYQIQAESTQQVRHRTIVESDLPVDVNTSGKTYIQVWCV